MPKEPKDTEEQPKSGAAAPSSSATNSQQDQAESSETAREAVMRLTSGNPRFIEAKPSKSAFELPMGKPSAKN